MATNNAQSVGKNAAKMSKGNVPAGWTWIEIEVVVDENGDYSVDDVADGDARTKHEENFSGGQARRFIVVGFAAQLPVPVEVTLDPVADDCVGVG